MRKAALRRARRAGDWRGSRHPLGVGRPGPAGRPGARPRLIMNILAASSPSPTRASFWPRDFLSASRQRHILTMSDPATPARVLSLTNAWGTPTALVSGGRLPSPPASARSEVEASGAPQRTYSNCQRIIARVYGEAAFSEPSAYLPELFGPSPPRMAAAPTGAAASASAPARQESAVFDDVSLEDFWPCAMRPSRAPPTHSPHLQGRGSPVSWWAGEGGGAGRAVVLFLRRFLSTRSPRMPHLAASPLPTRLPRSGSDA